MTNEPENPEVIADELRALLRELGVVPRDLTEKPGEADRAQRDLARMVASASTGTIAGQRSRRRARRRRIVWVAAACALATALVLVRPWSGSDPAYARTPAMLHLQDDGEALLSVPGSSATRMFAELADRAERQPAPKNAPVQLIGRSSWLLSTDEGKKNEPGRSVIVPVASLQYFQPDGTVRTIEHRSQPLDRDGRLTDKVGQWSKSRSKSDETFEGPDMGPRYADRLPLDTSSLARQLIDDEAACKDARSYCLSAGVTFLHYNYVLEPDVNASLWRVLATEPTFRYLGRSEDRLGREAAAFSADGADPGRKIILLADPKTGAFLGSEEILVRDSSELGLEAPAVIEFTALEESRRVEPSDVPDVSETTRY
jgi:hypothetical protein